MGRRIAELLSATPKMIPARDVPVRFLCVITEGSAGELAGRVPEPLSATPKMTPGHDVPVRFLCVITEGQQESSQPAIWRTEIIKLTGFLKQDFGILVIIRCQIRFGTVL